MATLFVKPSFNNLSQQLSFPTDSINYFIQEQLQDTMGFYQSTFGLYSYMRLNKEMKYVIHSLKGQPLIWQPHRSCGWDETGSIRIGRKEFTPTKSKINESYCYDELFDSSFKHFLTWNPNQPVQMDENAIGQVNRLIQVLSENAVLGARTSLTVGSLHDMTAPEFAYNAETPVDIRSLFARTSGTVNGWVSLVDQLAKSDPTLYGHLNLEDLIATTDISENGKDFVGDATALYDALRDSAPADLQHLMDEGGIAATSDGSYEPLFLVSPSIYRAIAREFRFQTISFNDINPRLTRREFSRQGIGGSKPIYVYYIDDMPVIPISDINILDRYLTGTTHFAAITSSRNISLGASFADLPNLDSPNIGMIIQRETDVRELGKYYFAAHALFATTIADTDFFVGTQRYAVPQ